MFVIELLSRVFFSSIVWVL